MKLFGFEWATIARRARSDGKGSKEKTAAEESYVRELEPNASAKPTMVLWFDRESPFCRGALQAALNSQQVAAVAKENFRCLVIDLPAAEKNGVAKKHGVRQPQIVFSTPSCKVVAVHADPNTSAQNFLTVLDAVIAKTKKVIEAEAKAEAKKNKN